MGRCPRHPGAEAQAVCAACGDLLCATCGAFGCERRGGCPHKSAAGGAESWSVSAPWEIRDELGRLPAAWHTARRVLWDPARFFRDLPRGAPAGALLYGVGAGSLGFGAGLLAVAARGEPGSALPLLAALAALPFALHLRLLLAAGGGWLAVILLDEADDWPALTRIAGYAATADLLLAVPGLGLALAPLAAGAYRALGVRALLGVPRWVALVAGFGPTFAAGLLVLGAAAVALWTTGGLPF